MLTHQGIRPSISLLVFLVAAHSNGLASAALQSFEIPANTDNLNGNPVAAKATFTTSANSLQIVIDNLLVDPKASNQTISGIQFTLSGSPTGATFGGGNAIQVTFVGAGTPTYSGLTATSRWSLLASPNGLNALGGGQPDELIIGSVNTTTNVYTNGNGGLDNFVPYLYKTATFTINYTGGVTANSTVSGVAFRFGTEPAKEGIIPGFEKPTTSNVVPEPASMAAWLLGLACYGSAVRKRRKLRTEP